MLILFLIIFLKPYKNFWLSSVQIINPITMVFYENKCVFEISPFCACRLKTRFNIYILYTYKLDFMDIMIIFLFWPLIIVRLATELTRLKLKFSNYLFVLTSYKLFLLYVTTNQLSAIQFCNI